MAVDVKAKTREVSAMMSRFARELSTAEARVETAQARRATVVATQDRLVAEVEQEADRVVASMANELGPTLTAALTGRPVTSIKAIKRGGV